MRKLHPAFLRLFALGLFYFLSSAYFNPLQAQINFAQSDLDFNGIGDVSAGVTSLMYGPDDRLYVAEYPGTIKILTVQRNGLNDYVVTAIETLNGITDIVNHDDDGSENLSETMRETTGLYVGGTPANPVIYVASSDFRIGAGTGGGNGDVGLDTNSGIITRLTWTGTQWDVVDLVRGLPRSEENHATNGIEFATINGTNYLLVASGGITNGGSPSTNFVYTCEYALSGAVLSINLDVLNGMGINTDGNGRKYIYDLPTLDDPTRANANGITDPDTPGYDGVDVNDPFGGNDGLNQAIVDPTGPVQIYSPGYRNAYDLIVTESGALYVTDNGANQGWGGFPVNEGGGSATNQYDPSEPGSNSASGGEQIDNVDHLELVTTNIQAYNPGSFYGGHPNPTRANPSGAGLFTAPAPSSTAGAVWRTLTYDPDMSTPGSTNDPSIALPANWPPVPSADPVQGDWRGPSQPNPDGPLDNPVQTWGTNTNGIDEYTASNFGGVMQGNLIAGVNTGVLRRVELNPDGTVANFTASFASGLGGNALGVSCNDDGEIFPGTIWAGTLNGKIVVLEPDDLVNCIQPGEPQYDPLADYDNDGYTNGDEIDNGTDHCNGGSQPADFDKIIGAPLFSDLNDLDDDADGIDDKDDPMQLGNPATGGSDAFTLPILNGLFNDQQGLGGIFGLGMTGLMNNGDPNPNWLEWLDETGAGPNPDDVLGGAPGLMTSHMTSGTANGTINTQEKGYQYGVQVDQTTGVFTVSGNLINFDGPLQLYGNTAAIGGELGLFIGDGTQSNFIKFVITTDGLTALQEINDVPQTPINISIPVPNRPNSEVVFYFVVNPTTGVVSLEYQLDGGARNVAGTITAQGSILNAIQQANADLMVGFIGTSNTSGVELEGTWDFLNVTGTNPYITQALPDLNKLVNDPPDNINLDEYFNDDNGVGNLSYSVQSNTDPTILAVINANILTLTYPAIAAISDITIRATDGQANFVEQTFNVNVTEAPTVLYRINAGGPAVTAIDGGIDWEEDTPANNSVYLTVPGSNSFFPSGMTSYTSSVNQSTTPTSIFDTERADIVSGTPNMTYSFPVAQPGNYEVRLYIGNGFAGTSDPGDRIFDVEIEGMVYPELSEVDLSATYGHQTGHVFSHILNVSDGSIDISFLHGIVENPIINGIEILEASDTDTPIYVYPIANQTSNTGEQLNGSLGVQALGGDGNLVYAAQNLPPGITIEPTNGQIGGTVAAGAEVNSPYFVTITVDDSDNLSTDSKSFNFLWFIVNAFSYRINAGGQALSATDIGADWEFNAQQGAYDGGVYSVNTGLIVASGIPFVLKDNSIPAYIDQNTFNGLFAQERYDDPTGPEMEFSFPLENGDLVVNLYMGNAFSGTNQPGQRIFDIAIEGAVVENNLDLITQFGHQVAGMLSYPVQLNDGELNIQFLHDAAENPLINAIEIFEVDTSNPVLTLNSIADQTNQIGEVANFSASASGGDPGESFRYYISGQPDGVSINSNTGQISGTIASSASNGGPAGDGIHSVVVTVLKPQSAPASQSFAWNISTAWNDKNENESYTARHENSFVQAGDKFYLMGGRENSQTIDVYDYTSDTWNSLVDSAPFEFNHFQATEYQGLIWIIGALKDNNFPSEAPAEFIWIFDPANQEWLQGPQIPVGRRRGSTGLVVYNDKFYVVAGNTNGHDGGFVPWFDEYDPVTGTWTALTDAPRARDHFAAAVINDKLYVSGGRLSGGTGGVFAPTIAEVDVYDFITNTWSTLPAGQNIPTPRGGASTVNFEDKLFVIGGEVQNELVYGVNRNGALEITESFDPVSQTWNREPDLNFARHGTQAIVSGPGIHILAGSPNLGGGAQKNMEYYGTDNPDGSPSVSSDLITPAGVQIADGATEAFNISVENGNVGIFVESMTITGPDAADFSIVSGDLNDQLLLVNATHSISVELTGTGPDRNAVLTITYGNGATADIILSNSNVPPTVENPGTQYNNEGETVSLQIVATDNSSNLTYSATNLPPNLTIDANTGLISGTIATGAGESFLEENGLVVIEAESGTLDPTWTQTTTGGATGIIAGTNHLTNQNGGTIPYQIEIVTPGVYRFNWRSFYSGGNSTEENDNWLKFPNMGGVWFFGYQGTPASEAALIAELEGAQNNIVFPVGSGRESAGTTPNGDSSNGYFKIFRVGGTSEQYDWQAFTSDNDNHDIYVRFENAGVYTMEISERSAGHAIDKLALYKVDGTQYSDAQLTAAPESQKSGGGGAADNSPYAVMVTVADDGVPPLDTTVDFTWIIGQGENLPPTAIAEADPVNGQAPLTVNFTGSNSADDVAVVSYLWDFMDGNTSTMADPSHIFTGEGTYVVSLTVEDAEGLTDTDTVTIIVTTNQPPVSIPEATPISGDVPLLVDFTGSNSTDDLGIVGYLWDFDDGGATSIEADPQYTFNTMGTYNVSLTVTDEGGLEDTEIIVITVTDPNSNQPPVAIADADPLEGIAPLEVTFTGSNSTDDIGIVSYLWDFDDNGATSDVADPMYTFTEVGTYNVSLTVTDAEGLEDMVMLTITVNENMGPTAVATANPTAGDSPLTVNFTGSNSTDDVGIDTYLWDFQDGNTSTEADPTHIFNTAGTYVVELTVTDAGGLSDTTTVTIEVTDPGNMPPVAVALANPTSGDAPLAVIFDGSLSYDDISIVSYLWDFQDGMTSTEISPQYSFEANGVYNVTLTVTDGAGLTDTTTVTIVVGPSNNQPPTAVIEANPMFGSAPLTVNFEGRNSVDDFGIVSYYWVFGDGTTSNEVDPTHTYTANGEYTVVLVVTDEAGFTGSATATIVVDDIAGEMVAIAVLNPTQDGEAIIRVLNKPNDTMVNKLFIHDNTGRLISEWDAQTQMNGGDFVLPVNILRDGLYIVSIETLQGDIMLVKILVAN